MTSYPNPHVEANALNYLKAEMSATRESIEHSMKGLTATHPSGYLIRLLEDVLMRDYDRQEETLKSLLGSSPSKSSVLSFFDSEHRLLRKEMVEMYNTTKQMALQYALFETDSLVLKKFNEEKYNNEPESYFENFAEYLEIKMLRKYVGGWLLPSSMHTSDPDTVSQLIIDDKFRAFLRVNIQESIERLQKGRLTDIVSGAVRSMEAALEVTVQEMVHTRPAGYLMVQLELTLNQEYYSLKRVLQAQLKLSPYSVQTLKRFDTECASLRTRMIDRYKAAKKTALRLALTQAGDAIDAYLKKFDVNDLWRGLPLEECEDKLSTCLQQLARDVEGSVLQKCATGWLLTQQGSPWNTPDPEVVAQVAREKSFLKELRAAIQGPVDAFNAHWQQELMRLTYKGEEQKKVVELEALRRTQPAATMSFEDKEPIEKEPVQRTDKTSTSDQKRKAAEWAAQKLKQAPSKKTVNKKQPAPKLVKSVEQQRADALAYAKKLFDEGIGVASPSPIRCAPPDFSMEDTDPVKAARAEAQRLAKERANAAAMAAAERARKAKNPRAKAEPAPVAPLAPPADKVTPPEALRLAKESADAAVDAAASAAAARAPKTTLETAVQLKTMGGQQQRQQQPMDAQPCSEECGEHDTKINSSTLPFHDQSMNGAVAETCAPSVDEEESSLSLRREAQQLTRQYETDLKAQVTQLLQSFENKAGELFVTRPEALSRFAATEKAVQGKFQARIADIVGNVAAAPGTPVAVILGDYAAQLQDIHTSSEAQFLALYNQQFTQWLLKARKAAEKTIDDELLLIEQSLPLIDQELTQQLEVAYRLGQNLIGGTKAYGASCTEAVDAEQVLHRYFESASASVQESNARLNQSRRREAEDRLQEAMRSMEAALEVTVQEMVHTRPAGYLMVQLEQTLNREYHSLKTVLQAQLKLSPYSAQTLERFDMDCVVLRTRMIDRYNAAKKAALRLALTQAGDAIDAYLKKFDVNDLWRGVPLEECEDKRSTCLQQLARDVEGSVLQKWATGWLLSQQGSPWNTADPEVVAQVAREQTFLRELRAATQGPVDAFSAHWQQTLKAKAINNCAKSLCRKKNRLYRGRLVSKRKKTGKCPSTFNPVFGLQLDAQTCFQNPTATAQPAAARRGSKYVNPTERSSLQTAPHVGSAKKTIAVSPVGPQPRRKVTCPKAPPKVTSTACVQVTPGAVEKVVTAPTAAQLGTEATPKTFIFGAQSPISEASNKASSKPRKKVASRNKGRISVSGREKQEKQAAEGTDTAPSDPSSVESQRQEEPELKDIFPPECEIIHFHPSLLSSPVLSQMEEDFATLSVVSERFAEEFKSAVQSRETTPQKAPKSLDACLVRSGALRGADLYTQLLTPRAEEEPAAESVSSDEIPGTAAANVGARIETEEQGISSPALNNELFASVTHRGVLRGIASLAVEDEEDANMTVIVDKMDEVDKVGGAVAESVTVEVEGEPEIQIVHGPIAGATEYVQETEELLNEGIAAADEMVDNPGAVEEEVGGEEAVVLHEEEEVVVTTTVPVDLESREHTAAQETNCFVCGSGVEPTKSFPPLEPFPPVSSAVARSPIDAETAVCASSCNSNGNDTAHFGVSATCEVGTTTTATQFDDFHQTKVAVSIISSDAADAGGLIEASAQSAGVVVPLPLESTTSGRGPAETEPESTAGSSSVHVHSVEKQSETAPISAAPVGSVEMDMGQPQEPGPLPPPKTCDAATNTEPDVSPAAPEEEVNGGSEGDLNARKERKSSWWSKAVGRYFKKKA